MIIIYTNFYKMQKIIQYIFSHNKIVGILYMRASDMLCFITSYLSLSISKFDINGPVVVELVKLLSAIAIAFSSKLLDYAFKKYEEKKTRKKQGKRDN